MYGLKTNAKVVGVYFSLGNTPSKDPELSCSKAICDLFDNARYSALVSIYSLSEKVIIDSMIAAYQRDVDVVVVADYLQSKGKNMNQYLNKLEKAEVPVFLAKKQKACMHNKCGIFDSYIVSTGSYNWTANGTRKNDENLIVMEGKDIADLYKRYVIDRIIDNETLSKINQYRCFQ